MQTTITVMLTAMTITIAAIAGPLRADPRDEFCAGFEEGYRSFLPNALTPLCPLPPLTPLGSTPFREGLKAGMERAQEDRP